MTKLKNYMQDGANHQARSVLCFLQGIELINVKDEIVSPDVARWENCREQGYIVSLTSGDYARQLNIIFFEHRNADSIHAVKWEQKSINSIGISNAEFGDIYKGKFDTSHSVQYGQIKDMSDWIEAQLIQFLSDTV